MSANPNKQKPKAKPQKTEFTEEDLEFLAFE
jgi:hypothetical protein